MSSMTFDQLGGPMSQGSHALGAGLAGVCMSVCVCPYVYVRARSMHVCVPRLNLGLDWCVCVFAWVHLWLMWVCLALSGWLIACNGIFQGRRISKLPLFALGCLKTPSNREQTTIGTPSTILLEISSCLQVYISPPARVSSSPPFSTHTDSNLIYV